MIPTSYPTPEEMARLTARMLLEIKRNEGALERDELEKRLDAWYEERTSG